MRRTVGVGVFSGAIGILVIAAGLVFTSRLGNAQQLPPPNEPPKECCHLLSPGGRTIGGPAVERLQRFGGESDYQTKLLNSEQAISMCATLSNLNDASSDSGHMLLLITDRHSAGRSILNPFPDAPEGAVVVHPGRTVVRCGYGNFVGASCLTTSSDCQYRWRIDLVAEPQGVVVRSPR